MRSGRSNRSGRFSTLSMMNRRKTEGGGERDVIPEVEEGEQDGDQEGRVIYDENGNPIRLTN